MYWREHIDYLEAVRREYVDRAENAVRMITYGLSSDMPVVRTPAHGPRPTPSFPEMVWLHNPGYQVKSWYWCGTYISVTLDDGSNLRFSTGNGRLIGKKHTEYGRINLPATERAFNQWRQDTANWDKVEQDHRQNLHKWYYQTVFQRLETKRILQSGYHLIKITPTGWVWSDQFGPTSFKEYDPDFDLQISRSLGPNHPPIIVWESEE